MTIQPAVHVAPVLPTHRPIKQARIRALLVGINNFPNLPAEHQLRGCVNDTQNVCQLLVNTYGAMPSDIRQLHDERATRTAVLERLAGLIALTRAGEIAVFHISTHGALITRREPSGALKNHASEILCLSDISSTLDDSACYISDSDLTTLLAKLRPGALFIAIMDACHAGATRIEDEQGHVHPRRRRVLPIPADLQHRDAGRKSLYGADNRHRLFERSSRNQAHVLILTACAANQTSNDQNFGPDGSPPQFEGAFTHFLCDVLGKNNRPSYQQLLTGIQSELNKGIDPQTPEFMPSAFAGQTVFQTLIHSAIPIFTAYKAPIGKLHFSSNPGVTTTISLADNLATQTNPLPGDATYTALLQQLTKSGFDVHTLPEEHVGSLDSHTKEFVLDMESHHMALLLEYHDGLAIWSKPASQDTVRTRSIDAQEGAGQAPAGTVRKHFLLHPMPESTRARGFGESVTRIFHAITHPIESLTLAGVSRIEQEIFKEGLFQLQSNSFGRDNRVPNPRVASTWISPKHCSLSMASFPTRRNASASLKWQRY